MEAGARSWRHVFLLALAFLVLWWQPGVYMNDEVSQAAAMTALADGELTVNGTLDPGYEPFTAGAFRHFALPDEGQIKGWTANVPMMVVALPLLFALRLLESGLGIMGALGLVAGTVIGSAVAREMRWRGRLDWGQGGFLAGLAVFAAAWPRDAGFQATPILEIAAQQFVGMVAIAGAAVLLWDLARRIWGRQAATVALLVFLVATPAFFWAGNLKYHGFAMAGMAWALHALWRATQGRRWAWAEAGLATGVAFWNHAPTGLTMMAAFGVVGLVAMVRHRSWTPALGVPGFLVGVAPDLALRWWYRSQDLRPRYFGGSSTGDSLPGGLRDSAVKQVEKTAFLDAPLNYLTTLWELLVWTPYLSLGSAMGVLAMAPFLAMALRKWKPHPLVVWSVLVGVATIVGSGDRLVRIGAGIDQRYVSALWPMLVIAVVPALRWFWNDEQDRHVRWGAIWSVLVALWTVLVTALLMLANGGSILYRGFAYDITIMHRILGLGLFAGLAVAWMLRHRLPHPTRPFFATVPLVFCAGLWFTLGISGSLHSQNLSTPFVVWPLDLLVRFTQAIFGFT